MPIFKNAERDSIRPLGIRNPLLKAIHKEVMRENRQAFTQFLEPQQLVLSVGGGCKLVFSVRMLLKSRQDFCCVKNDFCNAYAVGGMAKAGADDLNAIGPPEVVFPALEQFWAAVEAKTGLTLQRTKKSLPGQAQSSWHTGGSEERQ